MIAKRSKQGERTDLRPDFFLKSGKSSSGLNTHKEIATLAGVSHDTVAKVKKINTAEQAGRVDADTVAKVSSNPLIIPTFCDTPNEV